MIYLFDLKFCRFVCVAPNSLNATSIFFEIFAYKVPVLREECFAFRLSPCRPENSACSVFAYRQGLYTQWRKGVNGLNLCVKNKKKRMAVFIRAGFLK